MVFSRTLEPPLTWNNTTLVSRDLASAVPAMKAEDGDPLRLIGSLSVLRSLLRLGLVDRLRLLLFPQLLGATGDESVFENLGIDVDLRLESTPRTRRPAGAARIPAAPGCLSALTRQALRRP